MQRLVESFYVTESIRSKISSRKANLTEGIIKFFPEKYLNEAKENDIVLWEMPISRYGVVNANGRLYSRKLWEKVINEQKHIWQGQVGLADHPKDTEDGNFKEAACVWLDMRLDEEGLVWGTCTFVGPYGRLAEEVLQKGGRIGFSSSGLGDLLDNGEVDPNTYIIERPADIVLNPSQNVFGKLENMKRENSTIKDKEGRMNEKVSSGKVDVLSKIEEKRVRKDIERFLNDAEQISDPREKLKEIEEILSFVDAGFAPDLKDAVERKAEELRKEIDRLISEGKEILETFKVSSTDDLKDGIGLLAAEVQVARTEAQDWEKLARSLNEKIKRLISEHRAEIESLPKREVVEKLMRDVKTYKSVLRVRTKMYRRAQKALVEKIRGLNLEISKRDDLLKRVNEKNDSLRSLVRRMRDKIVQLKKVVESKNKIIRAKEKEMEIREAKIREELTPKIIPPAKDRLAEVLNINEKNDVEKYFEDLILRHGRAITKYRERFLRCRSLKEATQIYFKVLPLLNEGEDYYDALSIPEGVGVGIKERQQLLEESGIQIDNSSKLLTILQKQGLR